MPAIFKSTYSKYSGNSLKAHTQRSARLSTGQKVKQKQILRAAVCFLLCLQWRDCSISPLT